MSSPRRASISVFFKKEHQRDGFPYRLKGEVVSKALTLGGGSWSVYGLDDMGFSNDVRENAGSYQVKMTGYNYDDLYDWAYAMRDTLLSGITVNAAIYILNEFNTLRRQYTKVSPRMLYVNAFRIKIVPILLTVLSTILGFLPFIVGESKESFWYPLAIGTMGGFVMSLVAVFLILPIAVISKKNK